MFSKTSHLLFKKKMRAISLSNFRGFTSKIWKSADEAVKDIPNGATLAVGGFGQ